MNGTEIKTTTERRLDTLEGAIKRLEEVIVNLQVESEDSKEALEHVDDSLQNLRYTVSAIKTPN